MRRHRRSQHGGTALPAALVALVVAASFAAALADLARTEVILARYRQVAAAALAAADACLAAVVAAMPPGWDFDPLLAGPDGVTGTGDDGMLGAPAGCTATARRPPGAATPAHVAVTVDANAAGGRRRLDAIIGRTRPPGVPAIVWLGGSPTAGAVRGTLDVDGSDAADPSAAPSAMVAAPSDPLTLDAWLAGEGAHVTTHGTSPPLTAPSPPFSGLLARLTAAGCRLGILSNVDDDLLGQTLRHFPVSFDVVVTAQQVRSYKPAHGHFLEARRRIGGDRWLHAAQSLFHDVVPARELGIPVAWINRKAERPAGDAAADVELKNLTELADWMGA